MFLHCSLYNPSVYYWVYCDQNEYLTLCLFACVKEFKKQKYIFIVKKKKSMKSSPKWECRLSLLNYNRKKKYNKQITVTWTAHADAYLRYEGSIFFQLNLGILSKNPLSSAVGMNTMVWAEMLNCILQLEQANKKDLCNCYVHINAVERDPLGSVSMAL